jgi:PilZ domain
MVEMSTERRIAPRFALDVPLQVRVAGQSAEHQPATTRDLSASGVFFYMESALDTGSTIELTLELAPGTVLNYVCKVVRVETVEGPRVGMAAEFQ